MTATGMIRAVIAAISVAALAPACVDADVARAAAAKRRLEIRFVSVPIERMRGLSGVWAYLDEAARPPGVHELYRRNGLRIGRVRRRDTARVEEIVRRDLGATVSEAKYPLSWPGGRGTVRIGEREQPLTVAVDLGAGRTESLNMAGRALVMRVVFENVGVEQARISLAPYIAEPAAPDSAQQLEPLALSILCARGEMVLVAPEGVPLEGLATLFTSAEGAAVQVILVSVTAEPD